MRAPAVLILLCAMLLPVGPAFAGTYHLMLGSKVASFDHPPVAGFGGETYITLALLDELGVGVADADTSASDGQDEQPGEHYAPDDPGGDAPGEEDVSGEAQAVELTAPPTQPVSPAQVGRQRYRLASHVLDVAPNALCPDVILDGTPLPQTALRRLGGQDYMSAEQFSLLGLRLAYNVNEDLYQMVGLIHRVEYSQDLPALSLRCLTPVTVDGVQVDDQRITVIIEGGFLADTEPQTYRDDQVVEKLGFKSQPGLGRSFIFIRQPRRTGFRVQADPDVGFARVRFGNYFQVASYQQSSSGELAVVVQLGAPCEVRHEQISGPPRVVVDFPGVVFEDATMNIPVEIGRVERIRVGRPEPGTARVVLDLTEHADYRLLSTDDGARYYIQLLPPLATMATATERRSGRTIMVDPGHGGSDPGAEGVLPGVWEAELNLEITRYLIEELSTLGYTVLSTRGRDRFVSLGARADYANQVLPYIFVSVHCNSIEKPDFTGVMTFHHPASFRGPRLAALIHEEVLRATGAVDKGVRQANFFVLRETVMPSALVECGFLTHLEDCRLLTDPAYQARVARGIARGIDRYVTGG